VPASLAQRLDAGPLVGSFVGIPHPAVVEVMAWAGFDFLCIDGEHAALGPADVEELIRAADACGIPAIVRVFQVGPEVGHALDSGAAGVLVPRVESAAQAAAAVAAVRYPPAGSRGAGIGRAARYGRPFAEYLAEANERVLLAVQVETRAGVEAAAEIAAVPGVDLVFVGPGDLAVSLGVPMWAEEHRGAVESVLHAAGTAGVRTGIFCLAPDQVHEWENEGVRLFLLSGDLGLLGAAGAGAVEAARPA
jgi:4-hydroxy-2-oxoheptanedioate aldolase